MTHCLSCGAEASDGLVLCRLCRRRVGDALQLLPLYFTNLARWRPGTTATRTVPGSRQPTLPGSTDANRDRVLRALDEANVMLVGWAEALTDDRPQLLGIRPLEALFADLARTDLTEAQTVALVCQGLARWLTSIATLEWAGEFVRQVADAEERLRRLTEAAAPGWYAGGCKRCQAPTYVAPGLTWVTCRTCGVTTHAADHLEIILTEARGWVAPPRRLAEALVALLDSEESVPKLYDRIRKWASLGWVEPVWRTRRGYAWDGERFVVAAEQIGAARYRLGDVLEVATGATRVAPMRRCK